MKFLFLLLFLSLTQAQTHPPTTTTSAAEKSISQSSADTLTLVLVFVFLALFIIVFCIICYIRNHDHVTIDNSFSPHLLPTEQRESTGQNQVFFSQHPTSLRNTGHDTIPNQNKFHKSAPAINKERSLDSIDLPQGPSIVSSLVKKSSNFQILERPVECPILQMFNFTIDEIIERDSFSIKYRGTYKGKQICVVRIDKAILEDEDLYAFQRYVTDLGLHNSLFPVYGIAIEKQDHASDLFVLTTLPDTLQSLRKYVRNVQPNILQKFQMLLSASRAIEHIHNFGEVVRHISTEDVMVDPSGAIYIDFFSKYFFRPELARILSPQALTEEMFDFSSDRYAFGMMIWEVLSEKTAWRGKTLAEITVAVVAENETPEMDLLWPPQIQSLMKKCFAEDENLTMSEISDTLNSLVKLYS